MKIFREKYGREISGPAPIDPLKPGGWQVSRVSVLTEAGERGAFGKCLDMNGHRDVHEMERLGECGVAERIGEA
ncbi:MAG: hypothetical protein Q7U51_08880 [Methanoregula sp.]|nr:hypothetical protein [Methanoregula sp.]